MKYSMFPSDYHLALLTNSLDSKKIPYKVGTGAPLGINIEILGPEIPDITEYIYHVNNARVSLDNFRYGWNNKNVRRKK